MTITQISFTRIRLPSKRRFESLHGYATIHLFLASSHVMSPRVFLQSDHCIQAPASQSSSPGMFLVARLQRDDGDLVTVVMDLTYFCNWLGGGGCHGDGLHCPLPPGSTPLGSRHKSLYSVHYSIHGRIAMLYEMYSCIMFVWVINVRCPSTQHLSWRVHILIQTLYFQFV